MKLHEEKVVEKLNSLKSGLEELIEFIKIGDIEYTDVFEQERLKKQVVIMSNYVDILQERIEHFPL